jgi:MFS transporter, SHS family, lactate transporter
MGSSFIVYYSVYGLFATHLQKDLHFDPAMVALPIALANATAFVASGFWGWVADRAGRRWSMINPGDYPHLRHAAVSARRQLRGDHRSYVVQGMFLGAIYGQNPSYLSERFPTEVRATASGFCYHQGAIWAGLVTPVMAFAASQPSGFAIPMLIGTVGATLVFIVSLLLGPETKGKVLVADITLAAEV